MQFIGRHRELQTLAKLLHAPAAGLLILYGRRRVGKTRLLTYFLEQHPETPTFYWIATTHNEAFQLRDFSQAILRYDPRMAAPPTNDFSFARWEDALDHLADIVALSPQPHLIILDEFTYLLRNEPAISSIFQKVWDHRLSQIPQMKLVLTGSLIGMMARQVIAYQAPLYGRATAQIHLRPLPYSTLMELFPERTAVERVSIYGVTGGVPAYLELFTHAPDFTTALRDYCLDSGSIMLSDPPIILYEQLQDAQTYESVLSAIAGGFHHWSEIAKMARVSETALGHYLKLLQELELVERREPILSGPNSKRGQYYVRDHFFRFYYRFIVPQLGAIARDYQEAATAKIEAELSSFLGTHIFEALCREWVWAAALSGKLTFVPELVGSYWRVHQSKGVQLDVVAAAPREKRLLIGEAKWSQGSLPRRLLTDLVNRSQRMPKVTDGWHTQYVLFAREGFTDALQDEARARNALLVSLEHLEQQLATS